MLRATRRSYFGAFALLAATVLLCMVASSSGAAAGDTTRISLDSSGNQAITNSFNISISADGRYVIIGSFDSNLVAGDTNNAPDVFVRDRQAGTTQRVTVGHDGAQANSGSTGGEISADGHYAAFSSSASNLVVGDTNGRSDVFVRDLQAGTTQLVTVGSTGEQANNGSTAFPGPSISADGRYVAFTSSASNLVADDTNGVDDVFVRDLQSGTTQRVGVGSSATQGNFFSHQPSISADGRYVAFTSPASNLVAGDTNGRADIFVRDLQAGTTQLVSVGNSGTQGNNHSSEPSISADGLRVAFTSPASDLVAGDTNNAHDVFVRDLQSGTTQRVSVGSSGAQGNSASFLGDISAGGCYVALISLASNLVTNDTNTFRDVFVRNLQSGTTERVSVDSSGTQANAQSSGDLHPSISEDGRYVAFHSFATNLVAGDTNGTGDVFVHERAIPQPSDCTAPSTTASASTDTGAAYTSGTWTNEGVELTLSAQDNEGGSDINDIRYSATGAQAISSTTVPGGSAAVNISTEGSTTISYFATDNAGNQESPAKTFTVKIDSSAPTTSATATDGDGTSYTSGTWTSKNVTVELNANDGSDSGVKEISYSLNGGEPTTMEQSLVRIPVTSEGETTISYHATDNATNEEAPQTFTVKLDKSAPTVASFAPVGRGPTGAGWGRGTNVTATFSDEMNESTLSTQTIKLVDTATGRRVTNVVVSYNEGTKTVTLDPFGPTSTTLLAKNTKYKVTVTTGAKNLAGLSLDQNRSVSGDQPKSWTFTTR